MPVYAEEFADPRAPPFPPAPHTPQGAFHASHLAYLFPMPALRPRAPGQRRLPAAMLGYGARFTATGDPDGAPAAAWPRYPPASGRVQVLAPHRIAPTTTFPRDHQCACWNPAARPRHPAAARPTPPGC